MCEDISLEARLDAVEMVVLDVDGVLTDGAIWIASSGEETLGFNVRDGMGIRRLMDAGVEVALLSGRNSEAASNRARQLGVKRAILGRVDKLAALNEMLEEAGMALENVAYVGDDLADLEPVEAVGVGVAVGDAAPELREAADIRLSRGGGRGAARELAEMILKRRGLWP